MSTASNRQVLVVLVEVVWCMCVLQLFFCYQSCRPATVDVVGNVGWSSIMMISIDRFGVVMIWPRCLWWCPLKDLAQLSMQSVYKPPVGYAPPAPPKPPNCKEVRKNKKTSMELSRHWSSGGLYSQGGGRRSLTHTNAQRKRAIINNSLSK